MTAYARWADKNEISDFTTAINKKSKVKSSGLPIMYDEESLYIDDRLNHSLVIGTQGSAKTQTVVLPMLELGLRAEESIVVHDSKSELYDCTHEKFEKSGYKIIQINFDDPRNCNFWNPFDLVEKTYQDGKFDKTQELIENIGHYLLYEKTNETTDPFWNNSAINYFTGIVLYMLKNNIEVNLNKISEISLLVQDKPSEFIKKIDKKSSIYINLMGVLNAPNETRGSIFSVFNQKINKFISKQDLTNMMSKSDFNIENIDKEKTIVYIVSGNTNNSNYLLPLLINQLYFAKENKGCIRVIIDDFFILNPIKDFSKLLNYSKRMKMAFTVIIRGFNDLKNIYGKEEAEIIQINFTNILYLLSRDLDTLREISDMCGNTSINDKIQPLITIEELKTLKMFEAVYLTLRIMPFKTKLLPYYKIEE